MLANLSNGKNFTNFSFVSTLRGALYGSQTLCSQGCSINSVVTDSLGQVIKKIKIKLNNKSLRDK